MVCLRSQTIWGGVGSPSYSLCAIKVKMCKLVIASCCQNRFEQIFLFVGHLVSPGLPPKGKTGKAVFNTTHRDRALSKYSCDGHSHTWQISLAGHSVSFYLHHPPSIEGLIKNEYFTVPVLQFAM